MLAPIIFVAIDFNLMVTKIIKKQKTQHAHLNSQLANNLVLVDILLANLVENYIMEHERVTSYLTKVLL